jgi:hypothetical protein
MELGALLTHLTAGAAFFAYAFAVAFRLMSSKGAAVRHRLAWTFACALLLIHVACAFHFVHHWSHRAAYEATVRQTAEVTGFASGGGIHANYALLMLWLGDVLWWWLAPAGYRGRARATSLLIHGFIAFMWFNATAVFGHGLIRWLGAATFLILFLLWLRHLRSRPAGERV